MVDAFARMHARLFARLGQEALLRGQPTAALIEHGVEIIGEYGQIAGFRSVATLPVASEPKKGDALTVEGKTWILDAVDKNDGYTTDWVLR